MFINPGLLLKRRLRLRLPPQKWESKLIISNTNSPQQFYKLSSWRLSNPNSKRSSKREWKHGRTIVNVNVVGFGNKLWCDVRAARRLNILEILMAKETGTAKWNVKLNIRWCIYEMNRKILFSVEFWDARGSWWLRQVLWLRSPRSARHAPLKFQKTLIKL